MFSKIRENIYLSSVRSISARQVEKNRIDSIVNLASEVSSPKFRKVAVHECGFHDTAEDAAKYSEVVVSEINKLLDKGKKVVIHCHRGASRSPHIVASVLSERENRSYEECYEEVRSLHPRAMEYSLGEEIKLKNIWG